jgi:hypothetical protein
MMIGLIGSEDEEDAVEEDLDDDIDSMYDAADAGGEPENADDKHSETGESTNEKTNIFQGKDFTRAGHLPQLLKLAENIIVRLPGCVKEAKNANTPHDVFSRFISDDILNIILTHTHTHTHTHTNQKISGLSLQLHWQGSEMDAENITG